MRVQNQMANHRRGSEAQGQYDDRQRNHRHAHGRVDQLDEVEGEETDGHFVKAGIGTARQPHELEGRKDLGRGNRQPDDDLQQYKPHPACDRPSIISADAAQ